MPINANATEAAIAINIVMVKACAKRGEKVFNAYILSSIRFDCCWCIGWWLARLFSFCSSVVNANEWGLTSSRYGCTIGAKNKGVKFFFNFFFRRGVGCVGARVWVLGCGGVWVWVGGIGMGRAGWRRDWDGAGWIARQDGAGESSSQGVPIPDSDCRLGCDR